MVDLLGRTYLELYEDILVDIRKRISELDDKLLSFEEGKDSYFVYHELKSKRDVLKDMLSGYESGIF